MGMPKPYTEVNGQHPAACQPKDTLMKITFDRGTLRLAEKWAERSRLAQRARQGSDCVQAAQQQNAPQSQTEMPQRSVNPQAAE